MHVKQLVLLAGALWYAAAAIAHSPYLLPNRFDVTKRDHVSVQGSFTEQYLVPDVVMKADDYHAVMPDGTRTSIVPTYTQDLAVLDVATTQDGTYRLSTGIRQGRTGKAALMPDGKWQFFDEREGAPAGGMVHEIRSVTRAEVYVSRGTPTDAALKPSNQGYEFQMLTHPNRLLAGAAARLRVLHNGNPVPAQVLTIHKAMLDNNEPSAPQEITSGSDGVVSLTFAAPGVYHVMARYRFVLPSAAASAESHTYAVTLEVTE